jgi:6-phosphogluconolactonase/glucosamine-6-phosphate isomerase/deaminase
MSSMHTLQAGAVTVHVVEDERRMGELTAARVADQIRTAVDRGLRPVLWLMAAPSAFAFYRSFIEQCRRDNALAGVVRDIPIYQFDDYPVARSDVRFPVTFRALLEEHLFKPLAEVCGALDGTHPLELTGSAEDAGIAAAYGTEVAGLLASPECWVIQVKGIGMDGHWGFHGAATPLDAPPQIARVPIGPQNVRQQRIDWPDLFPRDEDVPSVAYSATVSLFLKADYIIDNVPQESKQFAVLACYGTDQVTGDVPSSALKEHTNAEAVVTRVAAEALLVHRDQRARGRTGLPGPTISRLRSLWDDPANPELARANCEIMMAVLEKLRIV